MTQGIPWNASLPSTSNALSSAATVAYDTSCGGIS
eukprot:CAMPEP_0169088384 /NCGR_PEP_ID=MMETSP1015-20121227/14723_1 /TAXON_ID=342587 /ORGANISM="Karlodinium micrum, Strain CCMP2283" /LENGTH=34 /DNA_ID= /DNA_START= /DNA_END= /DNA_ORIENTATION=